MASIQSKISRSGKKVYYVVMSLRGKRKWIKAGTQKDAKFLKKKLDSLAENERQERLGISAENKQIDKAFHEFIKNVRLRTAPGTVKRYRAALNAFIAFLSLDHTRIRFLSQITPEIIESFQKTRLESVELKKACEANNPYCRKSKLLPKPQTVNYEVGVLRAVFI